MAKPANHDTRWTKLQVQELGTLAKRNTPTRVIGIKLGRTPAAVQKKASEQSIPLKPPNQSPYNRRPSR